MQAKPKAIMDRKPESDRAAGLVFPDSVLRQTKGGRSICAAFSKGTCKFAKCKSDQVFLDVRIIGPCGQRPPQVIAGFATSSW